MDSYYLLPQTPIHTLPCKRNDAIESFIHFSARKRPIRSSEGKMEREALFFALLIDIEKLVFLKQWSAALNEKGFDCSCRDCLRERQRDIPQRIRKFLNRGKQ